MVTTVEQRRDALRAALEAGDAEAVVQALAGAPESDRRALKPVLDAHVPVWEREGVEMLWDDRQPFAAALRAARLGIETLSELKKDWRELVGNRRELDADAELAVRLLADRRPPWIASWVTSLFERPGGWPTWFWPTVRALVRAGLCERPEHSGYVLGMLGGVVRELPGRDHEGEESWQDRQARRAVWLAEDLQADADLLETELWLLFSTEGTRDAQLNDDWARALVVLSDAGVISRARLLDASLEALARDFAQFKAGWYSRFHELLVPTLDERVARVDAYLALCASRIPPTVSFALDALTLIDRETPEALAPEAVHSMVPVALTARAQKSAFAALALLASAAARDTSLAPSIALALCEGLAHEAAAVQKRCLTTLETISPTPAAYPELWATINGALSQLAASLRDRAAAWLGDAPDGLAAGDVPRDEPSAAVDEAALREQALALPAALRAATGVDLALAALDADGPAPPAAAEARRHALPCAAGAQFQQITELDALIELHAVLLERLDDPRDLERLLDGLVRFAASEPPDLAKRLGPLLRRARTVIKRHWGAPFSAAASIPSALAGLVLAWAEREVPLPGPPSKDPRRREPGPLPDKGLDAYLVHRLREVAEKLAAKDSAPLLATPTHESGFIAPATLLARGRALTRAPGLYDAVQALLRLAPEGRAETLGAFERAHSEIGRAFRYALGGPLGGGIETPALWVAAARARDPEASVPALEKHLGAFAAAPDAARRATIRIHTTRRERWTSLWVECDPPPPKKILAALPTVGLHAGATPVSYGDKTRYPGRGDVGDAEGIKLAAGIWPLLRESYYAEGVRAMGGNLGWWEAEWQNRHFLEPLLDPLEPCGEMATLLIALGLCAKETGESALALDIAIAAIEEGRLDGQRLGTIYGQLLPTDLLLPGRLAQSFAELARVSKAHAAHARVALIGALRGEAVRGINAVLELLLELCIEADCGVEDGEARAFLEAFGGSSKAAVAARALLALATGPKAQATARAAALAVLEGRLRRAESLM